MSWDKEFKKMVNRMVHSIRQKGKGCDIIQDQGDFIYISISNGDQYKEIYRVYYQGRNIIGEFVQ